MRTAPWCGRAWRRRKSRFASSGRRTPAAASWALIRAHFAAIHKTFTESAGRGAFPIQEFVCLPQYPALRLDYQDLLIREREGELEIRPTWQNRVIRLNLAETLNDFVIPEARREDRKRLFPKEERMKEERSTHIEVHGNVYGSNIIARQDNQVEQTIRDGFNAGLSPEAQTTLAQLTAAVQEMLKHMTAEQAEEARDNLEYLQEELAKPKPSRKWYSVSIEGLVKAARNVGAAGAPVIELAGKLLKIL